MLERFALMCLVVAVPIVGTALVAEPESRPDETPKMGVLDFFRAQAETERIDRLIVAQHGFWDSRDAIVRRLLRAEITLERAAELVDIELVRLRQVHGYGGGWPVLGRLPFIARTLIDWASFDVGEHADVSAWCGRIAELEAEYLILCDTRRD